MSGSGDSLFEAIERFFPSGTIPGSVKGSAKRGGPDISHYPYWPPDLFACMALLMERSGAYAYWEPSDSYFLEISTEAAEIGRSWRESYIDPTRNHRYARALKAYNDEIADTDEWSAIEFANFHLQFRWKTLLEEYGTCRWSEPFLDGELAPWCQLIAELLIIADEASADLGVPVSEGVPPEEVGWTRAFLDQELFSEKNEFLSVATRDAIWASMGNVPVGIHETLTKMLDMGHATVLPKMRTPQVGATLRAFSHYLALLPGSQEVRTTWYSSPLPVSNGRVLNMLVVPFPFDISSSAFVPVDLDEAFEGRWGAFRISQTWLEDFPTPEDFVQRLAELIGNSEAAVCGKIEAVVFPEASLAPKYFQAAVDHFSKASDCHVELFIAGLAGEPSDFAHMAKAGAEPSGFDLNVVGMAYIAPKQSAEAGAAPDIRAASVFLQPKHHRWKLDRAQIRNYGLSTRLSGTDYRWEHIKTDFRHVQFLPIRSHGVVATLVCEDLARIDPCQTVLRAVGPNLVVALLMDGPQLNHRWPGRYATVLAEDPGSSVLSITSAGLVKRSNLYGKFGTSGVVALWRDAKSGVVPIELKTGSAGFVLTIEARATEERTMDDRSDGGSATVFELAQVTPVYHPAWKYEDPISHTAS